MDKETDQSPSGERFCNKLNNSDYRRKFLHTLSLFLAFIFLGIRNAQHGSAFLDLAQITGTDVERASYFYTAMSIGGLAGTFMMSFLYHKLPNHRLLLLTVTCTCAAVTTAVLPWSTNFYLTLCIFLVNNIFNTGLDNGGNASLMSTWGTEGKTFMQFLHFSFSAGTMISPFTVQPFLSTISANSTSHCHYVQDSETPSAVNTQINEHSSLTNMSVDSYNISDMNTCTLSESRVQYAYLIGGVLCIMSGILFAIEAFVYRNNQDKGATTKEDHRNQRVLPTWLFVIALGLISSTMFFHCACGTTIVGYVMAFAVEGLGWSKKEGTMLNFIFWLGLCIARLGGVFIVRFLTASTIMLLTNSIVVLSLGGLWISVVQESYWGIYASIILAAFGLGVVFPTLLSYVEHDVMKVTGKVTSGVWMAFNLQGIALPPLLGYLMQEVDFKWYVYLAFIEGVICLLSFGLLVVVVKTFVVKLDKNEVTLCIEEEIETNFIPKSRDGSNNVKI